MTMPSDSIENDVISTEDVTKFLREQPHFFEKNAHLLTEIYLPSPHGNGAISLAERQQLAQRDKIRLLEVKLAQLIEFAEENEATSIKVHKLAVKLLSQNHFIDVQQVLFEAMQKEFEVTESTLLIWLKPKDESLNLHPTFKPVDEAFSDWIVGLRTPYTGPKPLQANHLVADHLQSFAFIPLPKPALQPGALGVLILASEKPHKFQVDMGTVYLQRIGELVAASLVTHI
jgi:uncharacterized protein YigA (DUF484 family)